MTAGLNPIETLVVRVQRDFLNAPTLALTPAEGAQRFGIDRVACEAVFGALVDAHVLFRTREGAYRRFFPRLRYAA